MIKVRLLVVDEDDRFLGGLASWLGKSQGFQLAGVAHSAQEALERVGELSPDLVLMNVALPDMSGLEAIRLVRALTGAPPVVLMTSHTSAALRAEARAAGAAGSIAKSELTEQFLPVIETLLRARVKDSSRRAAATASRLPARERQGEVRD